MNPFNALTRPEFLNHPLQIMGRIERAIRKPKPGEMRTVRLPWGASLALHVDEYIGGEICCYGIFDLIVCETIHRLLDPGETAIDIGANIGQMTSLMRHRTGSHGQVISFEPHPEIFQELKQNTNLEAKNNSVAPVALHQLALSDHSGTAVFETGEIFQSNRGTARLVREGEQSHGQKFEVSVSPLTGFVPKGGKIGLCKLDVEGHEMQVLQGAASLLQQGLIRDIVFEDYEAYPSPVHDLLLKNGYTIFYLATQAFRPALWFAEQSSKDKHTRIASDYVATIDPTRLHDRFVPGGWKVLKKA